MDQKNLFISLSEHQSLGYFGPPNSTRIGPGYISHTIESHIASPLIERDLHMAAPKVTCQADIPVQQSTDSRTLESNRYNSKMYILRQRTRARTRMDENTHISECSGSTLRSMKPGYVTTADTKGRTDSIENGSYPAISSHEVGPPTKRV